MIVLHVTYNKPLDQHAFGVYKDLDDMADAVQAFVNVEIPKREVYAYLVASDIYIKKGANYEVMIGNVNDIMVSFACGAIPRIKTGDLIPR